MSEIATLQQAGLENLNSRQGLAGSHPWALSRDVSQGHGGLGGSWAREPHPYIPEAPADPGSGLSDLSWMDGRVVSKVSPPRDRTRVGRLECHAVQRNVAGRTAGRTQTGPCGAGAEKPALWRTVGAGKPQEGLSSPRRGTGRLFSWESRVRLPPPITAGRPSCLGHLETALSPGGIPATRGTWTLGFMAQLLGLRDACLSLGLGVLICEMGAGR